MWYKWSCAADGRPLLRWVQRHSACTSKRSVATGLCCTEGTTDPRVVEWERGAASSGCDYYYVLALDRRCDIVEKMVEMALVCSRGSVQSASVVGVFCARNVEWFFFGDTRATPLQRI